MPVPARSDRRDHRDHFRLREQVEKRTVDFHRLADETEVENALDVGIGVGHGLGRLFGIDHVAVLAAQADRPFALGIDHPDDVLVDRTGQNHFDDLDGLFVGHAQATLEAGFDPHLGQHRGDLRTAAVNDDRVDAGLLEKCDILRERLAEGCVAHGMTTIFHHDRLVLVALHVGQGFGQEPGLNTGSAFSRIGHVMGIPWKCRQAV